MVSKAKTSVVTEGKSSTGDAAKAFEADKLISVAVADDMAANENGRSLSQIEPVGESVVNSTKLAPKLCRLHAHATMAIWVFMLYVLFFYILKQ